MYEHMFSEGADINAFIGAINFCEGVFYCSA